MAASTTGLPQKSRRANSHAAAIPSGVATSVATVATRSESWISVHSVGDISNTRVRLRGRADQEGESIFLEDRLRGRRAQEVEIAGGFRFCGRRCRDGIDDGGMGIRWKGADDLDAGFDLGIGRIDDPENSFAARHQCQRGAHALRHREFRFRCLPRTEFFECRPGVLADRNRFHVAGGDLAATCEFCQIEAWSDRDMVDSGILRRDQHDAVAEQVDPRRLLDGFLPRSIVHPVGIGGQENIRGRALFDLFCERRARGIARDDLDAGLGGVGVVDVVERVLHRGRGKHSEAVVLRKDRRRGRSAQDGKAEEKLGETMHRGAPCMFARRCPRAQFRLGSRWYATGGSAVPAIRRIYDPSGHRSIKPTASWTSGKGSAPSSGCWKSRSLGSRHDQFTAIMTSDALTTTMTELLALMPNSSTASLVIEEVTVWPLPISTRTCEVVAPFLTSMTVPLIWLRALMRMMALTKAGMARGVAGASVDYR